MEGELFGSNRSERSDPEGQANPEGEAEIRGETGIDGQKSGQRARGVEIARAGANRHWREATGRTDLRIVQRGVEEAGREQRPHNGSPATVVMGERKAASKCWLRTGETSGVLRQSRPATFKRSGGEHSEVTSHLSWTARLEAKRAGWERDWILDHLEPFLCRGRVPSVWCMYERARLFAYRFGRISPLYLRERASVHLPTLRFGACLAEPDCRCCHGLFVVRRVPLCTEGAAERVKPWHGRTRSTGR